MRHPVFLWQLQCRTGVVSSEFDKIVEDNSFYAISSFRHPHHYFELRSEGRPGEKSRSH